MNVNGYIYEYYMTTVDSRAQGSRRRALKPS